MLTPENVAQNVGLVVKSDWLKIEQERINAFGKVTDDLDPHHVDPEFCREHSPWGVPIAFGFLTLSLLTRMLYDVFTYPLDGPASEGVPVNYGFRNLRFAAPVKVNSRIRASFTVLEVTERKPGQQLTLFGVTVEIEGETRPALTAQWESVWIKPLA